MTNISTTTATNTLPVKSEISYIVQLTCQSFWKRERVVSTGTMGWTWSLSRPFISFSRHWSLPCTPLYCLVSHFPSRDQIPTMLFLSFSAMKLHCWSFSFGILLEIAALLYIYTCNLTILNRIWNMLLARIPSDKAVFGELYPSWPIFLAPFLVTKQRTNKDKCTLSLDHHLVTFSFFVGKSFRCCFDPVSRHHYVFCIYRFFHYFIVPWSHAIPLPKCLLLVLLPFSCQIYSLRWPLSALIRLVFVL